MGNRTFLLLALIAVGVLCFVVFSSTGPLPSPESGGPGPAPDEAGEGRPIPGPLADAPGAAPAEGRAALVVLVVNDADAPVEGAVVTTAVDGEPSARREGRTDATGRARFDDLPAEVTASVKASAGPTAIPKTKGVQLTSGQVASLRLVLRTGCGIEGVVSGENGSPLTIPFTVTARRTDVGINQGYQRSGSFPAESGLFALGGLQPGRYVATASAEGLADGSSESFELREGQLLRNVEIRMAVGGSIAGVVVRRRTGEPVAGAEVQLRPSSAEARYIGFRTLQIGGRSGAVRMAGGKFTKTDEQGRFSFTGLKPDTWALDASADGLASSEVTDVRVEPGILTSGVLLSLGEGGTLTGTVYGPDGRPVPNADLLLSRADSMIQISGDIGAPVKADANGVYVVEHLEPGKYRVRRPSGGASGMAVSIAISGRVGTQGHTPEEPEDDTVAVVREGLVTQHDLRSELLATIHGRVTDDQDGPLRRQVSLMAADPDEGERANPTTIRIPLFTLPDQKGEYSFAALEPGRYRVFIGGVEQEVEVRPGERCRVDFRLSPATVEILVLDSGGQPVKGARIRREALRAPGGGFTFRTEMRSGPDQTDEKGRLKLTDVEPGKYRFHAVLGPSRGSTTTLEVGPGEHRQGVRILLVDTVEVLVIVTDPEGTPVANAFVSLRPEEGDTVWGRTGADGTARLQAVPGAYSLSSRTEAGSAGRQRPAGRSVTVAPGGTQTFRITTGE